MPTLGQSIQSAVMTKEEKDSETDILLRLLLAMLNAGGQGEDGEGGGEDPEPIREMHNPYKGRITRSTPMSAGAIRATPMSTGATRSAQRLGSAQGKPSSTGAATSARPTSTSGMRSLLGPAQTTPYTSQPMHSTASIGAHLWGMPMSIGGHNAPLAVNPFSKSGSGSYGIGHAFHHHQNEYPEVHSPSYPRVNIPGSNTSYPVHPQPFSKTMFGPRRAMGVNADQTFGILRALQQNPSLPQGIYNVPSAVQSGDKSLGDFYNALYQKGAGKSTKNIGSAINSAMTKATMQAGQQAGLQASMQAGAQAGAYIGAQVGAMRGAQGFRGGAIQKAIQNVQSNSYSGGTTTQSPAGAVSASSSGSGAVSVSGGGAGAASVGGGGVAAPMSSTMTEY